MSEATPSQSQPPLWLVVITMTDESVGVHHGRYAHPFDALDRAKTMFPAARRINVRPIKGDTKCPSYQTIN